MMHSQNKAISYTDMCFAIGHGTESLGIPSGAIHKFLEESSF